MNVILASIFRNSQSYLGRYFTQAQRLTEALKEIDCTLSLVLAEGDSTDGTYDSLMNHGTSLDVDVIKVDHGGPVFGSIDNETRWRNISFVCNALLDRIEELHSETMDMVVYIESDLLWTPDVILNLIYDVLSNDGMVDAAAPICIHLPTGVFYDTFGHRADGARFEPYPPYHPKNDGTSLLKLDSAGSCIVMCSNVARMARFRPAELGIVGFGMDIKACGYYLYLDPTQKVYHP